MDEKERFDIYIPGDVKSILESDALLFEFYKSDHISVNMNRFLTSVILGYHTAYVSEMLGMLERIASEMEDILPDDAQRHAAAERIRDTILFADTGREKKRNKERISLKPTIAIQQIIRSIPETELPDASVSRYFCNLFASYCRKPIPQRERIVFAENAAFLEEACRKGWNLELTTTTSARMHEVVPFCIATGREEMFNYLLCAETGADGQQRAATFRINRIRWISRTASGKGIPENIIVNLKRMRKDSPLYPINDDPEIRIRMTGRGQDQFRKIYFGRPFCCGMETDGEGTVYSFDCSLSQAYLYFRRFEQDTIEVLAPQELREQMRAFFMKAVEPWNLLNPASPPNS